MRQFIAGFILFTGYSGWAQTLPIQITKDQPVEIIVFIGIDCPISQKYISRLNEIYSKYNKNVKTRWSFIIPEKGPEKRIKTFVKEFNVKFPVQYDSPMLSVTKRFDAQITPEVIIRAADTTVYKGAIDNWFYELGRYRLEVTEHYLIDALESLLKNEYPKIRETKAIGCFIQIPDTKHHQH